MPPAAAPAPSPPPAPTDACTTAAACAGAGKAARDKRDFEAAARFFGMACDKGDHEACADAAQVLIDRPQGAKGKDIVPFLEKGCSAGAATSCNGLGQLWHKAGNDEEAARAFGKACETGHGAACHNLAVLLQSGAIPKDEKRLALARQRACKAGEQEDCAPLSPSADKPDASSVSLPGANLTVGGMEVDGVLVETLACKVSGVGLLGAMVVAGTLAKQRGALRACGLKTPVPVGWTIRGGSVIEATANSGDAKKDACIVRALKQIKSTDDGVCRAKVGLK